MTGRWFRFYDEALDDPKVQRLSGDLFKTWTNLLCLASKSNGKLPSIDDVSFRLRISVQDAQQRIDDLIMVGLIDIGTDRRLSMHGWDERQYASDTSADRMKKYRARKRDVTGDVTGDASDRTSDAIEADTETDSEIDSEQTSVAKREVKEVLNDDFGGKVSRVSTRLKEKAEGFGLNVDALITRATAPNVKEPNAYFRKLAIDDLCAKLPRLSEQIIRTAFTKDGDEACKHVFAHLMGAN